MSLVHARAAAFDGDPASLARDNILDNLKPIKKYIWERFYLESGHFGEINVEWSYE